jgi:hypothetical protein
MALMVSELYTALRAANVAEPEARAAAEAVTSRGDMATKTDLADLKAELLKWMFAQWATLVVLVLGTALLK